MSFPQAAVPQPVPGHVEQHEVRERVGLGLTSAMVAVVAASVLSVVH